MGLGVDDRSVGREKPDRRDREREPHGGWPGREGVLRILDEAVAAAHAGTVEEHQVTVGGEQGRHGRGIALVEGSLVRRDLRVDRRLVCRARLRGGNAGGE